jgi:hypothetical protein
MNDTLVAHLAAIDERLAAHLDDDDEMGLDAVCRLREYADALLHGSITTVDLVEAWPDWFALAPAFVAAYAPDEVGELEKKATFLGTSETDEHDSLTEDDLRYLETLGVYLDLYAEVRDTDE